MRRYVVVVEVEVDIDAPRHGEASPVEKVGQAFRNKLSFNNYGFGEVSFTSSEVLSIVSVGRDSDPADVAADVAKGAVNG